MVVKKIVKGVKAYGNMYKEFYDAFKGREESYNKHFGITKKKKKK